MVSVIGLDSEKVQLLCDAANEDVDEANKVQIANFLCPVRIFSPILSLQVQKAFLFMYLDVDALSWQGNYAVSGGVKGVEALEAKAKSFKARMTVFFILTFSFWIGQSSDISYNVNFTGTSCCGWGLSH